MELGNMLFGNSRGQFEIPRTDDYEEPFVALLESWGLYYRGYPEGDDCEFWDDDRYCFDNGRIIVRPYDWDAECDCGADERMEEWHAGHEHTSTCYQTELRGTMNKYDEESGYKKLDQALYSHDDIAMPGFVEETDASTPGVVMSTFTPRRDETMNAWRAAYKKRQKFEGRLYDTLCEKHGVSRQFGAAVHCTCGRNEQAAAYWNEIGGHANNCRFVQPNFFDRETGLEVQWYKYPLRDSYMSIDLSAQQWAEIMTACMRKQS